jgi:transposase InsO family protein
VTQVARNVSSELAEREEAVRFLIRDRDAKFTASFDEVFRAEGIRTIRTPIEAPKANAFAERWVRTARNDCTDQILVFGRRQLEGVLRRYVRHYNSHRPHRGLELSAPLEKRGEGIERSAGKIARREILGGLIHEYERVAA